MNKHKKNGENLRNLRIKAGFLTMKDVCTYTNTPYRTWQNWENGIIASPTIVDMFLELFIKTKQNPYP